MSFKINTIGELNKMKKIKKKMVFICRICGTNLKKLKHFKRHKCFTTALTGSINLNESSQESSSELEVELNSEITENNCKLKSAHLILKS